MPLGQITALDFFCQKDSRKNGADSHGAPCRHSTVRDAKPDRTPGDQKAWTPENELALSGFVSPGGSCVRQTVIRGSLGTLVL